MIKDLICRFCGGPLAEVVGLRMLRLCETYLKKDQLETIEPSYPLSSYGLPQLPSGGVPGVPRPRADLPAREDCRDQARIRADLAVGLKDEITAQLADVRRWGAR